MKSTSIAVSLDTRRIRKDGTYPVILRLSHQSNTTSIKTGFFLKKTDWDDKTRTVKKSYTGTTNVSRMNNEIQKKKAETLNNILKLQDKPKKIVLSVTQVKQQIIPTVTSHSFYAFGTKLIKELRKAERIGTARSYEGLLNVLNTFNKGKALPKNKGGDPAKTKVQAIDAGGIISDLRFDEINYDFLKKFETYHLAAGNQLNGLAVYMRTIRSIYNQAIKSGLVDNELYPFKAYKIKTTPTKKRALEAEHLAKIIALELSTDHMCFDARNYFIASYLMYGMNFADMAFLKRSHIEHDRIYYRRKKTSKLYDIKITAGLKKILKYYLAQDNSEYVFPIIKRLGATFQERDIQSSRKRYNKKLKIVAKMCKIEHTLTSYVSRHSFATQALLQNVPVSAISAMLGHSSLKTTEIYLKGLPSNILDGYNTLILGNS